jgi:ketosteroid isomerase-like protein
VQVGSPTPATGHRINLYEYCCKAKIGAREDITPLAVRATMIFRPEEGEWKVVHRHADPITTPQPAESVIQE